MCIITVRNINDCVDSVGICGKAWKYASNASLKIALPTGAEVWLLDPCLLPGLWFVHPTCAVHRLVGHIYVCGPSIWWCCHVFLGFFECMIPWTGLHYLQWSPQCRCITELPARSSGIFRPITPQLHERDEVNVGMLVIRWHLIDRGLDEENIGISLTGMLQLYGLVDFQSDVVTVIGNLIIVRRARIGMYFGIRPSLCIAYIF